MAPKFTWSPIATTSALYSSERPESVRTVLCAGSKDATFSEMCVICDGIRDARGRRSVDFCFRPEPTRVLLSYRPDKITRSAQISVMVKKGMDIPSRLHSEDVGFVF